MKTYLNETKSCIESLVKSGKTFNYVTVAEKRNLAPLTIADHYRSLLDEGVINPVPGFYSDLSDPNSNLSKKSYRLKWLLKRLDESKPAHINDMIKEFGVSNDKIVRRIVKQFSDSHNLYIHKNYLVRIMNNPGLFNPSLLHYKIDKEHWDDFILCVIEKGYRIHLFDICKIWERSPAFIRNYIIKFRPQGINFTSGYLVKMEGLPNGF